MVRGFQLRLSDWQNAAQYWQTRASCYGELMPALVRRYIMLHTLESFANASGFLPEQVWDAADIPSRGLHFGKPTGSAMPLVWAHAEYVKLRRSLHDKLVFDMPPQTSRRYISGRRVVPCDLALQPEAPSGAGW